MNDSLDITAAVVLPATTRGVTVIASTVSAPLLPPRAAVSVYDLPAAYGDAFAATWSVAFSVFEKLSYATVLVPVGSPRVLSPDDKPHVIAAVIAIELKSRFWSSS